MCSIPSHYGVLASNQLSSCCSLECFWAISGASLSLIGVAHCRSMFLCHLQSWLCLILGVSLLFSWVVMFLWRYTTASSSSKYSSSQLSHCCSLVFFHFILLYQCYLLGSPCMVSYFLLLFVLFCVFYFLFPTSAQCGFSVSLQGISMFTEVSYFVQCAPMPIKVLISIVQNVPCCFLRWHFLCQLFHYRSLRWSCFISTLPLPLTWVAPRLLMVSLGDKASIQVSRNF